ncbi:proline rich transmembrane protein 1B-like [Antedon mediterranea]|uniref:proline rich transmembrane protein 1B-like n=1 Tax=Antedon mediterranea TaxID=105859 RepID=UPI003AF81C9D
MSSDKTQAPSAAAYTNQVYPPNTPGYPQAQPAGFANYIVQPVPVTTITTVRTKPKTYLVPAIIVTLFCCLPLGIVGIVYSVNSSSKFNRGDDAGAASSARSARSWTIAGLVCGIVIICVNVVLRL